MPTNSKEKQKEYSKQYRLKKKQEKEEPKVDFSFEKMKEKLDRETEPQMEVFKKKEKKLKKEVIIETPSDDESDDTVICKKEDENEVFEMYINQLVEQRLKEKMNKEEVIEELKPVKKDKPFFFQQEKLLEMGQKCLEISIPILIPLLLRPLLMPRLSLPNSNMSLPPRPIITSTQNSNNLQTNTLQPESFQVPTLNI